MSARLLMRSSCTLALKRLIREENEKGNGGRQSEKGKKGTQKGRLLIRWLFASINAAEVATVATLRPVRHTQRRDNCVGEASGRVSEADGGLGDLRERGKTGGVRRTCVFELSAAEARPWVDEPTRSPASSTANRISNGRTIATIN